jgi:hypothetical protein
MQNSTTGTPLRHAPVRPSAQGRLEFAGYDLARGGAEINTARLPEGGGEINTAIPREGRKSTRAGFRPLLWHRRRVDFCPVKSCSANSKRQLARPACMGGPAGWPGPPFFAGLARLSGRSGCPGPAVPARLARLAWPAGRLAGRLRGCATRRRRRFPSAAPVRDALAHATETRALAEPGTLKPGAPEAR